MQATALPRVGSAAVALTGWEWQRVWDWPLAYESKVTIMIATTVRNTHQLHGVYTFPGWGRLWRKILGILAHSTRWFKKHSLGLNHCQVQAVQVLLRGAASLQGCDLHVAEKWQPVVRVGGGHPELPEVWGPVGHGVYMGLVLDSAERIWIWKIIQFKDGLGNYKLRKVQFPEARRVRKSKRPRRLLLSPGGAIRSLNCDRVTTNVTCRFL